MKTPTIVHRIAALVLLLTVGLGADKCGVLDPFDKNSWESGASSSGFSPMNALCSQRTGIATATWYVCNVECTMPLCDPGTFYSTWAKFFGDREGCTALCADQDTGAHAAIAAAFGDVPGLICTKYGDSAITVGDPGYPSCIKPSGGPRCVPLITLEDAMSPTPPLCGRPATTPSEVCCPSPETGVPYLCRPLPDPGSFPGKGICAIDTVNDSISACSTSIQCYPGFCLDDTWCACAEAGEPCAASVDCCNYPSAGSAACVGGVCQ